MPLVTEVLSQLGWETSERPPGRRSFTGCRCLTKARRRCFKRGNEVTFGPSPINPLSQVTHMKRKRLRHDGKIRPPLARDVDGRDVLPHPRPAGHRQESDALEENVEAIRRWEQAALHSRSTAEQLSDWITWAAASGPVLLFHVAWFMFWVLANLNFIPGIKPFDRFPFPLLTMTVSLEAIFLALFVLASQNRLAHQSEKRAHLDLQIDLLAEREMTAVLQLLQDIARHLDIKGTVTPEQIRDLVKKTDIHKLTDKLDEMPEPGLEPAVATSTDPHAQESEPAPAE